MIEPNTTLTELLELARRTKVRLAGKPLNQQEWEALRMAELIEDMHEHLSVNGDFPRAWKPF